MMRCFYWNIMPSGRIKLVCDKEKAQEIPSGRPSVRILKVILHVERSGTVPSRSPSAQCVCKCDLKHA